MHKILALIVLNVLFFGGIAQDSTLSMAQHEAHLAELRLSAFNEKNPELRQQENELFQNYLKMVLELPESYDYSFKELPKVADLRSPDGTFRLINWNLPGEFGTHIYYCYFQRKTSTGVDVLKLIDKSDRTSSPDFKLLTEDTWYGCLYYDIIPVGKGKDMYYTLLGWDGNDLITNKKIIEILRVQPNGTLRFGDTVFKGIERNPRRIIFEYKADVAVSVHYDKPHKRIIFDHLAPIEPNLTGIKAYYVPDLTYDGLRLKGTTWEYVADLDLKIESNDRPYNQPK